MVPRRARSPHPVVSARIKVDAMCLERRGKEDFVVPQGVGAGAERHQVSQWGDLRRLCKGTGREEGHFRQEEQHEVLHRGVKFHHAFRKQGRLLG